MKFCDYKRLLNFSMTFKAWKCQSKLPWLSRFSMTHKNQSDPDTAWPWYCLTLILLDPDTAWPWYCLTLILLDPDTAWPWYCLTLILLDPDTAWPWYCLTLILLDPDTAWPWYCLTLILLDPDTAWPWYCLICGLKRVTSWTQYRCQTFQVKCVQCKTLRRDCFTDLVTIEQWLCLFHCFNLHPLYTAFKRCKLKYINQLKQIKFQLKKCTHKKSNKLLVTKKTLTAEESKILQTIHVLTLLLL